MNTEVPWVVYRFEIQAGEIIFKADGDDRWRGSSVDDPDFLSVVELVAKQAVARTFS
jgi:hypothetical protein